MKHPVVGADEDECAAIAKTIPEERVVAVGVGIEGRGRQDRWRGSDDRTDGLRYHPDDQLAGIESVRTQIFLEPAALPDTKGRSSHLEAQ